MDILVEDIKLLDKDDVQRLIGLYEDTFPKNERRQTSSLLSYNNEKYKRKAIFYKTDLVGIIFYWELIDFVFIEYLAFFRDYRNRGLGKEVLQIMTRRYRNQNIVLEIEPNTKDTEAMKRYMFYRKLGFDVVDNDYMQPSYGKEKPPVALWLMALDKFCDKDRTIREIYKNVYNI